MATPQDLEKIIRAKIEIMENTPDEFLSGVNKIQLTALNNVLRFIYQLETDASGLIVNNERNQKVVEQIGAELNRVFFGTEYQKLVADYIGKLDESFNLSDQYAKGMFDWSVTKNATNIRNTSILASTDLLIGKSTIQENLLKPIQGAIYSNIIGGTTLPNLIEVVQNELSNKNMEGRLYKYARQISSDSLNTADRTYMTVISNEVDAVFFRYVGGIIKDSRDFCIERNGGYYHRDEIISWVDKEWKGKFRGTNQTTIFQWVGGYNCRHSLVPVSVFAVPKKDLIRAMQLGYFKPDEKLQNELGLNISVSPTKKQTISQVTKSASDLGIEKNTIDFLTSQDEYNSTINKYLSSNNASNQIILPSGKKLRGSEMIISPYYDKTGTPQVKSIKLDGEFLNLIDKINPNVSIEATDRASGAFLMKENKVVVNLKSIGYHYSPYKRQKLFYHELGHSIFHNAITNPSDNSMGFAMKPIGVVTDKFKEIRNFIMDRIKQNPTLTFGDFKTSLNDLIVYENYSKNYPNNIEQISKSLIDLGFNRYDTEELFVVISDSIDALTGNEYGFGHGLGYWNHPYKNYTELFAHASEIRFTGNPLIEIMFPGLSKLMNEYFDLIIAQYE